MAKLQYRAFYSPASVHVCVLTISITLPHHHQPHLRYAAVERLEGEAKERALAQVVTKKMT